jgi:hypothetical protein
MFGEDANLRTAVVAVLEGMWKEEEEYRRRSGREANEDGQFGRSPTAVRRRHWAAKDFKGERRHHPPPSLYV